MDVSEESLITSRRGSPDVSTGGWSPRRAVIVPSMLLYFLGIGIYFFVPPEFVQHYFLTRENLTRATGEASFSECHGNKSDPLYASFTRAQQLSAVWLNYFSLASSIPAMFTTLMWTAYSDVIGRKSVFILCSSGLLVKIVVITVVIHFDLSLVYTIAASVIDGLTGSSMTIYAVLFSYVADVTEAGSNRTLFIVLFELLMGVAITVSSFGTGYFITACGFFYPMLASSLLVLTAIIMMACCLPETLSRCHRGSLKGPLASIPAAVTLYTRPGPNSQRTKYLLLVTSFLLFCIPSINRGSLETLYQLGQPLCWSPTKIGYFSTIKIGLASVLGIFGVLLMRRCFRDDSVATISAATSIVSYVIEGLATMDTIMYTGRSITGAGWLSGYNPGARFIMGRTTGSYVRPKKVPNISFLYRSLSIGYLLESS